jgi:hypothetical protein
MDYPGKVITKTQVTPTQTSASGNWTLDDQAAAIKNNNWPVALVPNPISKSLRFNSADSAYLNRTPASAGNRTTWTWSAWVKRSALGSSRKFFLGTNSTGGTNSFYAEFNASDVLNIGDYVSPSYVWQLTTTQVFRDPSAWYHLVICADTSQATSSNRIKVYVNGAQVNAFSTASYPTQNYNTIWNSATLHTIGDINGASLYFDGYMTEMNFIDGQALTPSSFGMTNPQTGQWIPLKYSGTYGTNGFYLNFKDATSTTTLGYDYSGNANNWTTNNFSVTAGSGNDSLTDVPTPWFAYNTTGDVGGVIRGNYATLSALSGNQYGGGLIPTLTNGNLNAAFTGALSNNATSTIALLSGKWYCEFTVNSLSSPNIMWFGCQDVNGYTGNGAAYNSSGVVICNGVTQGTYSTFTVGDVIGCAFDITNNQVSFYKNNVQQGTTGTLGVTTKTYAVWLQMGNPGDSCTANFGQRPFAYTPPTGFRSLCTTNLPATAIGFGLTNQGGNYFNTIIWTGDNSSVGTTKNQTGVGFQPDFVWIKNRSSTYFHNLYDSVRGTGSTKNLISNGTYTEGDSGYAALYGYLSAFNSDGFQTTNGTDAAPGIWVNQIGENFVAWNWKASGSTVSNTAGTITSTVSANTTSGFSIVTYTGTGALGTVGHGLGVTPSMIIVKRRNSTGDWAVYNSNLSSPENNQLLLNSSAAAPGSSTFWGNQPSSSVFSVWTSATTNASGGTFVAYCFAPVAGYSAFGSYTGNGSATGNGPFVYLGFRPRYVLAKVASNQINATNWQIWDALRPTYNVASDYLFANTSDAESNSAPTYHAIDFLSNGFKLRCVDTYGFNQSGAVYIYAAFAESPFQFANAR